MAPWGAETRSCRKLVLVDEAAEELAPVQVRQRYGRVASSRNGGRRIWGLEVECAMRPPPVVVAHIGAEHVLKLAATEDQEPVEALAANSADPALDVRVRVRGANRRTDDPDTCALEQPIEGRGELAIAVMDEEAHLAAAIVEVDQQVARLLRDPGRVRVAGAGEVLDAP